MARPTIFTEELQAAIVAEVEAGGRYDDACEAHGVHRSTLYRWLERGELGEEPYDGFCDALMRARATAKLNAVKNVRAGMLPSKEPAADWKAEAWYLERTDSANYGPNAIATIKLEREIGGILDRLKNTLAPDQYDMALVAIVGEASSGGASSASGGRAGVGGTGGEGLGGIQVAQVNIVGPDGAPLNPPEPPAVQGISEPTSGQ